MDRRTFLRMVTAAPLAALTIPMPMFDPKFYVANVVFWADRKNFTVTTGDIYSECVKGEAHPFLGWLDGEEYYVEDK